MKRYYKNRILLFLTFSTVAFTFLVFLLLFQIKIWTFQKYQMINVDDKEYVLFLNEEDFNSFYHRRYFYILGEKVVYEIVDYVMLEDFFQLRIKVKEEEKRDAIVIVEINQNKKSLFHLIIESWWKL